MSKSLETAEAFEGDVHVIHSILFKTIINYAIKHHCTVATSHGVSFKLVSL